MTRLTYALAAVLAAATCLLLGIVIGREREELANRPWDEPGGGW
jgi:hypothetical protein